VSQGAPPHPTFGPAATKTLYCFRQRGIPRCSFTVPVRDDRFCWLARTTASGRGTCALRRSRRQESTRGVLAPVKRGPAEIEGWDGPR
jgi:hypothetical protein